MTTTAPFDLPVIEVETIDPLAVAQDIARIRRAMADLEDRLKERMATLETCYSQGLVPKQFEAAGYSFQLVSGRISYDWSGVPSVREAEASLKKLKAHCKDQGVVPSTVGEPSWRLVAQKDLA
jgi:hypothetical protein